MRKRLEDIKKIVKQKYAKIARSEESCCCSDSCCSDSASTVDISRHISYSQDEINKVPQDANLGLGCGNPVAIASLKKGDTVLDLGSGAGFDAFLAARKVGKIGRVIGVDMTQDMVEKARTNAKKGGFDNVEFRFGEIEKLPVGNNTIDVIISNCVINLSPDKETVFKEAFMVLKPGGRLIVSDLVLSKELPKEVRDSTEAYVGCIAGAVKKEQYLSFIKRAGFQDIEVISESRYPVNDGFDDFEAIKDAIVSIKISAIKR